MPDLHRYSFPAMGSDCVLHLVGGTPAIAAAAEQEVARIEARYSRYREDSYLAEINHVAASGGSMEVDAETAALIDFAFACHRKSGGLFDITTGVLRRAWNFGSGRLPAPAEIERLLPLVGLDKVEWQRPRLSFPVSGIEIDFGGIGKEYAADRAAQVCRDTGVESGLVDLGGDLCAIGPHPDGSPWQVDIRHPRQAGAIGRTIPLARGGLATSGDYERCVIVGDRRYAHILSPRDGWPVFGLASVTVVAETCLVAGALSTIAMLKGTAGPGWLQDLGVAAAWIDSEARTGGTLFGESAAS